MGKQPEGETPNPESTPISPSATSDGLQAERGAKLDEKLRPERLPLVDVDATPGKLDGLGPRRDPQMLLDVLRLVQERGELSSTKQILDRADDYLKWMDTNG